MAVSKRMRFEILNRDGFQCRYCGKRAQESELHVDHVVPVALGGDDTPSNLVAACVDCNAGKGSSHPKDSTVEAVSDDAVRWAEALRRAAEMQRAADGPRRAALDAFDQEWRGWTTGNDKPVWRDSDWAQSVARFFDLGLNEAEIRDAVRSAMGAQNVQAYDTFRYFCGICWNTIRDRQALAMEILEREDTACSCDLGPCEECRGG